MGFRNSSLNHLNKKDTYIPNCYFTTSSLLLHPFWIPLRVGSPDEVFQTVEGI